MYESISDQQGSGSQSGQQKHGGQSYQNQREKSKGPDQNPPSMDNDGDQISEIPGEHHNKEHQHEYRNPEGDQDYRTDNKKGTDDSENQWRQQNESVQESPKPGDKSWIPYEKPPLREEEEEEPTVFPGEEDDEPQGDYKKPMGTYNRGEEDQRNYQNQSQSSSQG